jgi:hypothetical protein
MLILYVAIIVILCIAFSRSRSDAFTEPPVSGSDAERTFRPPTSIEVRPSPGLPPPYNLGVFATQRIRKGAVIERAPYLWGACADDGTVGSRFQFGIKGDTCGVGMGFLGYYNHSDRPSLETEYDHNNAMVIQRATLDIEVGEEIFTSYGDGYWSGDLGKEKVSL